MPNFEKDYERNKRVLLKQTTKIKTAIMDESILPEFNEALDMIESRINDRNELVDNLFETVKKMLSNKMRDANVQTDVACWNGAVTYDFEPSTLQTEPVAETDDKKEATLDDKLE